MSNSRRTQLPDADECPCAGRNLERFIQPAILAVLARGAVHGYRIVQSLGRFSALRGRRPDAAGVYRFLKAMEDRGLVSSAWDLSESGPAKRLFKLSPKGRECLGRWSGTLEDYRRQISELLRALRRAMTSRPARRRRGRSAEPCRAACTARAKQGARP